MNNDAFTECDSCGELALCVFYQNAVMLCDFCLEMLMEEEEEIFE